MRITDKSLVEQQKITESELKQRLELFRITSDNLNEMQSLNSIIGREVDFIVNEFYERQTNSPEVQALIGDLGTLNRLMAALRKYIIDLFSKKIDLEYVESRLRVGLVHKRIGVDPKLYLSAINHLKTAIKSVIQNNISDPKIADELCTTSERIIDFDVSYVFDTYIKNMMNEIEIEKNKSLNYVNDLESIVLERTKELEKIANLDPLTNVYNKRAFNEFADKLFTEAQLKKESISIVYIDIDNFKVFNDVNGHKDGDDVLVALSDSLRGVSRSIDLCFRIGGDEFVAVLPGCTIDEAQTNFIPRLRKTLLKFRKDINITTGVEQSGPDDYLSYENTLKNADRDMYSNKKNNDSKPSLNCVKN